MSVAASPWNTEQAQEEGKKREAYQLQSVLEFQMKESWQQILSGSERSGREGEINFIVVFAYKKQWSCPAWDYSRNGAEKRAPSRLVYRDSRKLPHVLGWYLPVYAKVLLHFTGNSSKVWSKRPGFSEKLSWLKKCGLSSGLQSLRTSLVASSSWAASSTAWHTQIPVPVLVRSHPVLNTGLICHQG